MLGPGSGSALPVRELQEERAGKPQGCDTGPGWKLRVGRLTGSGWKPSCAEWGGGTMGEQGADSTHCGRQRQMNYAGMKVSLSLEAWTLEELRGRFVISSASLLVPHCLISMILRVQVSLFVTVRLPVRP